MTVHLPISKLPVVYAEFMEKHYFPKLKALETIDPKTKKTTMLLSWASVFFSGDIINFHLKKYADVISMLGVVDTQTGLIDLDRAREAAKFLMSKTDGGYITIKGFSLDSSDVDIIYNIAKPLGTCEGDWN